LKCKLKIDFFYVEIDMSCLKCGDFDCFVYDAVICAMYNNHYKCFKRLIEFYSQSWVEYNLHLIIINSAKLKYKKYVFSCGKFSYNELFYCLQMMNNYRHIKKIIREYELWKVDSYSFRNIWKIYWESIIKVLLMNTKKHKYIDLLSFSRSWIFEI
jgi:hypothetical protein